MLIEQININLTQKDLCYPMITRLLINILGLHDGRDEVEGETRVRRTLHTLLRSHFETAAKLAKERVSKLLPEDYRYVERKRYISYKKKWMDKPLKFDLAVAGAEGDAKTGAEACRDTRDMGGT
jgi:hypothetical protein